MTDVFFGGWPGLVRIAVVALLAYPALILMLRISGKRTLGKMNAFDLVVTVALGSTFATVLLDRTLPLAEGLLALALLVALQFAVTWAAVRSSLVRRLVKSRPTALALRGTRLDDALRAQRVTGDELEAALREHGLARVGDAARVTLETDGTLSVVPLGAGAGADRDGSDAGGR